MISLIVYASPFHIFRGPLGGTFAISVQFLNGTHVLSSVRLFINDAFYLSDSHLHSTIDKLHHYPFTRFQFYDDDDVYDIDERFVTL